jgi:hypothetical protein
MPHKIGETSYRKTRIRAFTINNIVSQNNRLLGVAYRIHLFIEFKTSGPIKKLHHALYL